MIKSINKMFCNLFISGKSALNNIKTFIMKEHIQVINDINNQSDKNDKNDQSKVIKIKSGNFNSNVNSLIKMQVAKSEFSKRQNDLTFCLSYVLIPMHYLLLLKHPSSVTGD